MNKIFISEISDSYELGTCLIDTDLEMTILYFCILQLKNIYDVNFFPVHF